MRVYFEFARRSFQRHLAYRQAALAGIFTNTVFGILIASVFSALYREKAGETVAGFDLPEILAFVWISQALLMPLAIFGTWEIADSIRSGDVVVDLMKPVDYYAYWLSRDLGRTACQMLTRFVPTLLVGFLIYDTAGPRSADRYPLFAVSVLLAALVSFAFRFMLNSIAFWSSDVMGMRIASLVATNFLSGLLVPLTFFPHWLRVFADLLPFRAFLMIPSEIFLGHGNALENLSLQLFWAAAMTGFALMLLRAATRKVVIQGG